jgi:ubiquinone/menaquinone biosynthesis C-methylase UbiE
MSQSQIDLEAFRNFERATHDKLAGSYYDAFSAVTDRAIEPLLKATCVENETRLLDVATGPGTLAAKAAERGARVIGIDIAPAMIALAHSLHPHLDFREGSAEELLFAPSSFDAVVSSFGVGHFSRPERVLSEFARVLVPKGRVALAWWDGFGKNRINGMFFEAINELGISALWNLALGSFVRVSTVILAQSAEVQQRIRDKVEQMARQYASPNGLQIPIAFRVITGLR